MRLALAPRRRFRPGRASRESWSATARRLRGPLYAAEGAGIVYQGGFGRSGIGRDVTVSAAVVHVGPWGELDIETSDEEPWGDDAFHTYRLASDWMHRAVRLEAITFPLQLRADRWERDVLVDQVPVRFTFVGDDRTWCAAGTIHGRQVGATGAGWPHEELALITLDPREVSSEVPDRPRWRG